MSPEKRVVMMGRLHAIASKTESGIAKLDGVENVSVSFTTETMEIDGPVALADSGVEAAEEFKQRRDRLAANDFDGAMKLGSFELAYTDASWSSAVTSTSVVRSYTTLRKDAVGDFGQHFTDACTKLAMRIDARSDRRPADR